MLPGWVVQLGWIRCCQGRDRRTPSCHPPAHHLWYSPTKTLWIACNLTASTHSLAGPVGQLFASHHEGPGFNPQRGTYVNRDSPASVVLLHWWPRRDWLLWPHLRRALSRTVTRPSYLQCDNPSWSHTALLSQFHARCRSSFWLHNRHSRLLGGSPVKSLQSHYIYTQSNWSSGSTPLLPAMRNPGSSPRRVLMWNWDSSVSVVSLQSPFWDPFHIFILFHRWQQSL